MELANIEILVEKYLHATTTLQEERILRKYFTSNTVALHLQKYQYLFVYFEESKRETCTKTILLQASKKTTKNKKWLQIAASIVLLIGMSIGYGKYQEHQQKKQLAKVTEALKLLSVNLKKGKKAVASLYTYEHTVNKIFNPK